MLRLGESQFQASLSKKLSGLHLNRKNQGVVVYAVIQL
jgi:hypothetical protein